MVDLAQYLAGGAATRPDSLSGLNPEFSSALAQLFAAAPKGLAINSAYRSPELQAQLWDDALAKYGSPEAARKWVAPPGRSQHGHGNAVDLGFSDDAARAWAHENAGAYGLAFPLANEPWHAELATARGGGSAPMGTPAPAATPIAAPDMTAAMGLMPGGSGQPGGGMLLGDIAAQFMAGQQQKQAAQREEQEAEKARRQALLGGGVASLYG